MEYVEHSIILRQEYVGESRTSLSFDLKCIILLVDPIQPVEQTIRLSHAREFFPTFPNLT